MSIQQAYRKFMEAIQPAFGEREAKSIARIVFEDCFRLFDYTATATFLHDATLTDVQHRLMNGEPLQYILGQADFYGLKFKVTPAVLIPRPETEELVYWILQNLPHTQPSILDIGTGSGCIPITLQKKIPKAQITALDVSEAALEVARTNAKLNDVKTDFLAIDILDEKAWAALPTIDIIVSNPPYIPYEEHSLMPTHVKAFEPSLALFVKNEHPLIFYQKIGQLALLKLKKGGQLFFECNEFNALKVVSLLQKLGFKQVELQQDMEGKDRMIRATVA